MALICIFKIFSYVFFIYNFRDYDDRKQRLSLVLEYGDTDFENFLDHINYITPETVQYFWKSMVCAVQAMHDEGRMSYKQTLMNVFP